MAQRGGPYGMPPPNMMKGMPNHPQMDPRAMFMREGPAHGQEAEEWEKAFADAGDDADAFEMFERAYGMQHAPGPRAMGARPPVGRFEAPRGQPGWADEFDQESKFTEFEHIYRTSNYPFTTSLAPFLVMTM